MANSLYPAFVKLNYTSGVAPHVSILPTRAYTLPGVGFDDGSYLAWNLDFQIDANDMIVELVTALAARLPTNANFIDYIIYTMATPTSDPLPVHTNVLDIDGTDAVASWQKGVQMTMSFRTTAFGLSKLVLLDASSGNNFDKITSLTGHADLTAIAGAWTADTNAWAGRDGARPNTFTQAAFDINDKLRRSYRMD